MRCCTKWIVHCGNRRCVQPLHDRCGRASWKEQRVPEIGREVFDALFMCGWQVRQDSRHNE
jgi:hypothetical protein